MRKLLLLLASGYASALLAQPFSIGSRSVTFYDPDRDRNIGTDVYYPAISAGNNAQPVAGQFPVIVIGHGFVMGVGAYANLRTYFVPKGYIVALPTTEGGFSPNHGNFGADLAFVAQALQDANDDEGSPFFGTVAPSAALMGHSMGGGASMLGAAGNTNIQAVVGLAPAETNPSAIAAAADIVVPTLIFAGSNDCVTPIADHQGPIYDALNVECRAFVNILGGGHCHFANFNFNCNLGELICSGPTISRTQQQAVVNDFAGLWLDHFLKGDAQAFVDLQDSLLLSPRVETESACLTTGMNEPSRETLRAWPNPVSDRLFITGEDAHELWRIHDLQGRVVAEGFLASEGVGIPVTALTDGVYLLALGEGKGRRTLRFLVVR